MPKSSKKRKDKAADFTKAKLKLGKGKQAPSNAVDTSFKARSIALPTQSIAVDRDADAPSTKRRLTFDALIAHLKHYNASTRKDAILGLRELLEAHPELIATHLTALVNNCVRLIGDEDASVRKGLLVFFAWLFRQVPPDDLVPHSPVLLLFTTSAQTHIFPEIRIDAVRFLDVYLEYIPAVVTEGWMQIGGTAHGRRVLEGYLGILSAGTTFGEGGDTGPVQATSTASVVLSPASKLIVLRSLSLFLSQAITSAWRFEDTTEASGSTMITPTWYLSSSFASRSAFEAFDSLLRTTSQAQESTRHWTAEVSDNEQETFVGDHSMLLSGHTGWSLHDLDDAGAAVVALQDGGQPAMGTDAELACVTQLARTLHSTLVSTFLDCAPTVFSPSSSPPETELQMVLVVCRICRTLYGRILQDSTESGVPHDAAGTELQTILAYLSPYFPFTISGPSTMRRDIKAEQAFQDLNLIFCELSSFIVLASQRCSSEKNPTRSTARAQASRPALKVSSAIQTRQVERVSAYIVQLLQGHAPSSGGPASIPRPIPPQAYVALLPTIWSLVNHRPEDDGDDSTSMFDAVVEHAVKATSTSATKRHTIDFIGRLVLLDREPEYLGLFRVGRTKQQDASLKEWILQLPKTLWELGSNHPNTSETIIRVLLRLSQRRSQLLQPETYAALRSRLLPYFSIKHPSRGQLPGPFTKLSPGSPLRRLVLNCIATILAGTSSGDDQLETIVNDTVRDSPEATYWAGIRNAARR
ncbi:hypothetical protein C8Q80DRAFT_1093119 [Daedaleopsis nitida]|nr:hypothetical protein C8Q80DRAFT_1093119 [Daedaleopsis nitida]